MKNEELLAIVLVALLIFTPLYLGAHSDFVRTNGLSDSDQTRNPSEILPWLGFGVLVFQAWISYRQAEVMANQAMILERQTTLSFGISRAFVSVKEFKTYWLHNLEDTNKVDAWRITPVLENSGNTTARKFICMVNFEAHKPKLPENFDYPDIGQTRTSYPTLIRAHGTIDGPSIEISVPILAAVKHGICEVFIWGWAEYSDSLDIRAFKRL